MNKIWEQGAYKLIIFHFLWFLSFYVGIISEKTAFADEKNVSHMEMTVTATKTEIDEETVPFTIHSVKEEEIEKQPEFYMNNVGEIIRDVPGVHVGQYYPWGPPWIHLRGTGYFIGRTIYLVDGLPVASFMASTIDPKSVERADVVLGPSSALYGANASGGAVNFITKKGTKDTGAKAEISYGSNETYRPHVSIGNKQGNFRYYASYSGDYSDGYQMKPVEDALILYKLNKKQYLLESTPEENDYETSYFSGKVNWENGKDTSVGLSLNYTQRYLYGGQKNFILDDNGDQAISNLTVERKIFDWMKLKFNGAYQYYDHPQQYNGGLSLNKNGDVVLDSRITRLYDWEIERIPLELQSDFYIGKNNILTTGVFWSKESEIRDTLYLNPKKRSISKWTTDQTALYIQDQLLLMQDRLSIIGGLRYDSWEYYDIYDGGSTNKTPDGVSKDIVTYRGGIKYRVNDNIAIRTSAGTAYWPGTALWFFQNVSTGKSWREANPNLKPEKTWMVDAGADFNSKSTGTSLNVTGYYGEIDDTVSYRYDENPYVTGGSIIRSQNLGGVEIYGLELGLKQKLPLDGLWLNASLTLNHSEIIDDPLKDGNQLRNAPDYFGSVQLLYLRPELFNTSLLFRFSDDRYYDDENTDLPFFHMSEYETLDLKVWRDWKLAKGIVATTSLSAINIFDRDYETEIVYKNPGRYIEGTIGVKYAF